MRKLVYSGPYLPCSNESVPAYSEAGIVNVIETLLMAQWLELEKNTGGGFESMNTRRGPVKNEIKYSDIEYGNVVVHYMCRLRGTDAKNLEKEKCRAVCWLSGPKEEVEGLARLMDTAIELGFHDSDLTAEELQALPKPDYLTQMQTER